ncbi:MAG: sugar phosphate nucleotidyltransferase [Candidatus Micrarchaeota archaeon]
MKDIPVVILAGGKGMRMRDYSENIPKALVQIGPYPVILHVMKIYAKYGVRKFILSLGYKSEMIREFFDKNPQEGMDVECVDTGLETQTGGRVKLAANHIDAEDFFVTYCDGLSDISIGDLYSFHKKHSKIGTMSAVHPMSPFGMVEINGGGLVESFREKPFLKDYINGGFFVFSRRFLDYVAPEDVLEEAPMRKLVQEKQLAAYRHEGFWTCMDTFKDVDRLNSLWYGGEMTHMGYKGKVPWL